MSPRFSTSIFSIIPLVYPAEDSQWDTDEEGEEDENIHDPEPCGDLATRMIVVINVVLVYVGILGVRGETALARCVTGLVELHVLELLVWYIVGWWWLGWL